jgi:2-polyprenyl-6-methoxyphenol hydroxylase-like FAD-dependent oxidoreductase
VVGVSARMANGERREFRAKVVVGADGKYSKVAQWVNAHTYEETPGLRPMYYGHYFGVEPLDEPTLEISFTGEQIGFMFPMRPDEDCLALEVLPDDFEAFRRNPQEAFEERYRTLPGMAKRMRNAQLDGKIHGARGIDNYLRKPYGPGWALTGDAGYLKDPSTGLGISDALQYAFRLASALDQTLNGADWEATMSAFHQARDASALPMYRWTLGATTLPDAPRNSILWLRAALANPNHTRQLLYWLPKALSRDLPPHLRDMNDDMAEYFGAQPIEE